MAERAQSAQPRDTEPVVVLAADHRARGIVTLERYAELVGALRSSLPHCDGLMATVAPLRDLVSEARAAGKSTWLSLNRTGLAGSAFELDDRPVASVERARGLGCSGIKVMVRIDMSDRSSARALEMLGRVLEEAEAAHLDAMVEPLSWRNGAVDRRTEAIVLAAVVAHDIGSPLLKVPVPEEPEGAARQEAMARVVAAVGVPVLALGGPRSTREQLLVLVGDAMAGGASGVAVGRSVYQDPDPGRVASLVADLVHSRRALTEVLELAS